MKNDVEILLKKKKKKLHALTAVKPKRIMLHALAVMRSGRVVLQFTIWFTLIMPQP